MKPDGGPAFPLQTTVSSGMGGTIDLTDRHRMQYGMTLRDYAVIKFQAALIGKDGNWARDTTLAAAQAAAHADAMIAERDK